MNRQSHGAIYRAAQDSGEPAEYLRRKLLIPCGRWEFRSVLYQIQRKREVQLKNGRYSGMHEAGNS